MSWMTQTFRDYSEETSTFSLFFDNVSAGGGDWDTIKAAMLAVGAAIEACSYCEQSRLTINQALADVSQVIPSDEEAQREIGCRIFYADDVNGKVYHVTVPGPRLDVMAMLPGTDRFDLTDAPLSALVSAIESNVESEFGNTVTVLRAVLVGRRS